MSSKEIIYKIHLLLNKNNEDSNINIETSNLVLLFNREALRFLQDYIEKNNSSDNILNIQNLIKEDVELKYKQKLKDRYIYELPEDYFQLIHDKSKSKISKNECEKEVYNYIVKPNNIGGFLKDTFNQPSFEWERGVGSLTGNNLNIYVTDFKVESTTITYYKKPIEIDVKGYINLENKPSKDIDTDISDIIVEQIIDRVVLEIQRQFVTEYQVAATRERIL